MNGAVAACTRNTPWRQGHVLTTAAVQALALHHPDAPDSTCVVIISHDCDLAGNPDVEPCVEVIVGRHLPRGDGNYFWAKSPRTLHIEVLKNGNAVIIELIATAKRYVPKQALFAFSPDTAYSHSGKSLSALRSWLAVRYNRAGFPDRFVNCMRRINKHLEKKIKPVSQLLSAVYFDVDSGKAIDHEDGSPYDLQIILVYPPGDDAERTADKMEKLETEISNLFEKKYFDQKTGQWNEIALKDCMSISEDDLSVSQARLLTQWRLEYMTIRAEEERPRYSE